MSVTAARGLDGADRRGKTTSPDHVGRSVADPVRARTCGASYAGLLEDRAKAKTAPRAPSRPEEQGPDVASEQIFRHAVAGGITRRVEGSVKLLPHLGGDFEADVDQLAHVDAELGA
jgi:hypothetical protein